MFCQYQQLAKKQKAKSLGNAQRWHHPLFLAGLATYLVRYLEPKLYRVAFTRVDAVQEHLLLHAVLLQRSNISARLRSKLQCVGLPRN